MNLGNKKFNLLFLLAVFVLGGCGNFSGNYEEIESSTTETTAPVIAEVTAVTTPNNDSTPNYTFSSDEAGTITYGGSCSSSTTSAISGNNTITFNALSNGTYINCTITVTDSAGNVSNTLEITSFTVDTSLRVFVGIGHLGYEGTIVKSTDNGSSFSTVTSPTSNHFEGVGFGNNTFVGVGYAGNILRSTDNGASFSTVTSPFAPNSPYGSNRLYGVGFGNNTFVAVGNALKIVRSTDNGTTWVNATSPTAITALLGVEFGNNTFVAVGTLGKILRSTDNGASWSTVTSPTSNDLLGVGFGNNTFVGVGDSGTIVRSTDNGSSFDNATSPTANDLRGVAFSE